MQVVTAATSTGSQTDVALPHTMLDILWTPATLDPIVDFYDGEPITEGDGVLDLDTFEESLAEFKIGAFDWNNLKTLVETNTSEKANFCAQYSDCSCKSESGTEVQYKHGDAAGAHFRPRPNLTHHLAEKARPLEPGEWTGLGNSSEDIFKESKIF